MNNECKNKFKVNGKVERTTKDNIFRTSIIIRERRCEACKQIHKTTEFSQDQLTKNAKVIIKREIELEEKISKLKQDLSSYRTILQLIKDGMANLD